MLIDTHAHINLEPLVGKWNDVVHKAHEAGVERLVIPGVDLKSSCQAINIVAGQRQMVAAVGIHPCNAESESTVLGWEGELIKLANKKGVKAIGEVGLDYFRLGKSRVEEKKLNQRKMFATQLRIAQNTGLPVIIHTRTKEALEDAVTEITNVFSKGVFKGVFHCFCTDMQDFELIMQVGGLIGIGGMLTYARKRDLQDVVANIPLKYMVLETDAPELVPAPLATKVNEPRNVTITALKLAQVKGIELSKVAKVTAANAEKLFFS